MKLKAASKLEKLKKAKIVADSICDISPDTYQILVNNAFGSSYAVISDLIWKAGEQRMCLFVQENLVDDAHFPSLQANLHWISLMRLIHAIEFKVREKAATQRFR